MAKLTSKARKALPKKDFAGPDGSYPIPDASHARNALSRVSANGSPVVKAKVRAAVHRKFPSIGKGKKGADMTPAQAYAGIKKPRKGAALKRFKKYA